IYAGRVMVRKPAKGTVARKGMRAGGPAARSHLRRCGYQWPDARPSESHPRHAWGKADRPSHDGRHHRAVAPPSWAENERPPAGLAGTSRQVADRTEAKPVLPGCSHTPKQVTSRRLRASSG